MLRVQSMEVLELDHSNELVARVLTHFWRLMALPKLNVHTFPNQFPFQISFTFSKVLKTL